MYILLTISTLGAVSVIQPWESNVFMMPSGLNRWLNPVKACIWTFKVLVDRCRNLLMLWLSKAILMHKFPCLLKLPSASLEWPASFFCLPLPSMYGRQFWISPREVQRLQTNRDPGSFHIEPPPSYKADYFLWPVGRKENMEKVNMLLKSCMPYVKCFLSLFNWPELSHMSMPKTSGICSLAVCPA